MEYDFLNIRSILIFICILQGLIFAGLLVNRGLKQKTKADLWLALLLVVATGATALSGWLSGLNMALRLAMAASAAIILIAIVWRTDADARAALRR